MTAEGLIAISTCSRISSASYDTVAYALLRNDQNIQLCIIRYATLLHQIGDNREGSEQSTNVDRKSLEFSICRQSGKQNAIQKVCF